VGYLRDAAGEPYATRMIDLGAYVSLVAAAVVELADELDLDRPADRKMKVPPRRPVQELPPVEDIAPGEQSRPAEQAPPRPKPRKIDPSEQDPGGRR